MLDNALTYLPEVVVKWCGIERKEVESQIRHSCRTLDSPFPCVYLTLDEFGCDGMAQDASFELK